MPAATAAALWACRGAPPLVAAAAAALWACRGMTPLPAAAAGHLLSAAVFTAAAVCAPSRRACSTEADDCQAVADWAGRWEEGTGPGCQPPPPPPCWGQPPPCWGLPPPSSPPGRGGLPSCCWGPPLAPAAPVPGLPACAALKEGCCPAPPGCQPPRVVPPAEPPSLWRGAKVFVGAIRCCFTRRCPSSPPSQPDAIRCCCFTRRWPASSPSSPCAAATARRRPGLWPSRQVVKAPS